MQTTRDINSGVVAVSPSTTSATPLPINTKWPSLLIITWVWLKHYFKFLHEVQTIKIICDKTVLSVMKYMQNCHRKCTVIDKNIELLGQNGLTVIPNSHGNKKLKIYFRLDDLVTSTGKICAVSWDLRLLSNNLEVLAFIRCHRDGCNYTVWQKLV